MSAAMSELSVSSVCEAVHSLYHAASPEENARASAYLDAFQHSMLAWTISDKLLHEKRDLETCYMGAQTLRTKIELHYTELPDLAAKNSLKASLYSHVSLLDSQTNSVIVKQLCLALADLLLQTDEWKRCVMELIELWANSNRFALNHVLTVMPEEINSRHLSLGSNRREEVMADFAQACPSVSAFLISYLQSSSSSEEVINIFHCLMSWIQLGVFPLSGLESSPLITKAFEVLHDTSTSGRLVDAAGDLLCSVLERIDTDHYHHKDVINDNLELQLFTHLKQLEPVYIASVEREDHDRAINLCKLFTEFAEAMLTVVLQQRNACSHYALPIFNMVILCCYHPDYEVADRTFNLWYRLSEELYQRDDSQCSLQAAFKPTVETLVIALTKHCQIEPDHEGLINEKDDFADFRYRVSELIKDVVYIVGSDNLFRHLFLTIKPPESNNNSSPPSWEAAEASLFIMSCVARNLVPSEPSIVSEVLETMLSLDIGTTHVAVRKSAIRLVGELADWIEVHPQHLANILQWLVSFGLQNPVLASEAGSSLQSICVACSSHMLPFFDGLLQLMSNLDGMQLKPTAANGLIRGVTLSLASLDPSNTEKAVISIGTPLINGLKQRMNSSSTTTTTNNNNNNNNNEATEHLQDPVVHLDRISSLFRNVSSDVIRSSLQISSRHPCQSFFLNEVWPVLNTCLSCYSRDSRIMERCCRCLRFAIRNLSEHAAPILPPLAERLVHLYTNVQPHSCCLYLGSILVDEFCREPLCHNGLLDMLSAFLGPTMKLLKQGSSLHTLKEHPDTLDDFFRLSARFLLQPLALKYLKKSEVIEPSFKLAMMAVAVDHREANVSVMRYLIDFVHCARKKEESDDFEERKQLVTRSLDVLGSELIARLVQACVFHLPSSTYYDVADLFMELMLLDRLKVCGWLEQALTADVWEQQGKNKVTKKQMVAFFKDVTASYEAKKIADSLRSFARLFSWSKALSKSHFKSCSNHSLIYDPTASLQHPPMFLQNKPNNGHNDCINAANAAMTTRKQSMDALLVSSSTDKLGTPPHPRQKDEQMEKDMEKINEKEPEKQSEKEPEKEPNSEPPDASSVMAEMDAFEAQLESSMIEEMQGTRLDQRHSSVDDIIDSAFASLFPTADPGSIGQMDSDNCALNALTTSPTSTFTLSLTSTTSPTTTFHKAMVSAPRFLWIPAKSASSYSPCRRMAYSTAASRAPHMLNILWVHLQSTVWQNWCRSERSHRCLMSSSRPRLIECHRCRLTLRSHSQFVEHLTNDSICGDVNKVVERPRPNIHRKRTRNHNEHRVVNQWTRPLPTCPPNPAFAPPMMSPVVLMRPMMLSYPMRVWAPPWGYQATPPAGAWPYPHPWHPEPRHWAPRVQPQVGHHRRLQQAQQRVRWQPRVQPRRPEPPRERYLPGTNEDATRVKEIWNTPTSSSSSSSPTTPSSRRPMLRFSDDFSQVYYEMPEESSSHKSASTKTSSFCKSPLVQSSSNAAISAPSRPSSDDDVIRAAAEFVARRGNNVEENSGPTCDSTTKDDEDDSNGDNNKNYDKDKCNTKKDDPSESCSVSLSAVMDLMEDDGLEHIEVTVPSLIAPTTPDLNNGSSGDMTNNTNSTLSNDVFYNNEEMGIVIDSYDIFELKECSRDPLLASSACFLESGQYLTDQQPGGLVVDENSANRVGSLNHGESVSGLEALNIHSALSEPQHTFYAPPE